MLTDGLHLQVVVVALVAGLSKHSHLYLNQDECGMFMTFLVNHYYYWTKGTTFSDERHCGSSYIYKSSS